MSGVELLDFETTTFSSAGLLGTTMEEFDNIEDVWTFFSTIINWYLDQHFPMKRISCRSSKRHTPWLSDDIIAAIRKKHKAKHVAEKTGMLQI